MGIVYAKGARVGYEMKGKGIVTGTVLENCYEGERFVVVTVSVPTRYAGRTTFKHEKHMVLKTTLDRYVIA